MIIPVFQRGCESRERFSNSPGILQSVSSAAEIRTQAVQLQPPHFFNYRSHLSEGRANREAGPEQLMALKMTTAEWLNHSGQISKVTSEGSFTPDSGLIGSCVHCGSN